MDATSAFVYSDMVSVLKRSLIARLVAVILLAWTGVDLAVPSLCAADRPGSAPVITHAPDTASSGASTRLTVAHSTSPQDAPATATDGDCFCCAQILLPARVDSPLTGAVLVSALFVSPASRPRSSSRAFDHPPQLAL